MEQGEVAGLSDVENIDRICRAHAQHHVIGSSGQNVWPQDKGKSVPSKRVPCVYFNKNACN